MYNVRESNNQIILTLVDWEGNTFIHTIKKDEWGDLIICYLEHIEKVTRYDNLCDILEDREYFINCLEICDKSGDFGNLYEEIIYGNYFKNSIYNINHKIVVGMDSEKYQITFKTFLGNFIIQNDLNEECGQLNILIGEKYIGTFNDYSPYFILGGLNIAKMKTDIEKYLNELNANLISYLKGYTQKDIEWELIKMIMRLFPNHEAST